uniref:Uncharacterized protein n=1 Tax=Nelumbo nucifera TaxID=4432 RepID=A0A822ZHT4_NELNU|nr:TPA_asm: hypothetical protein HUJ06_015571 [Nelumbo nucifera]
MIPRSIMRWNLKLGLYYLYIFRPDEVRTQQANGVRSSS